MKFFQRKWHPQTRRQRMKTLWMIKVFYPIYTPLIDLKRHGPKIALFHFFFRKELSHARFRVACTSENATNHAFNVVDDQSFLKGIRTVLFCLDHGLTDCNQWDAFMEKRKIGAEVADEIVDEILEKAKP